MKVKNKEKLEDFQVELVELETIKGGLEAESATSEVTCYPDPLLNNIDPDPDDKL
jgi:hypothetical protein